MSKELILITRGEKACSNNHYEDQNCVPNENLTFKVKEIESNFHKID